jgi:septal ring factor EnvC (AmiA/AmiB activator)
MKKNTITNIPSFVLATIFAFAISFSVNADEMKLDEAKAEITRLEVENASLKQELEIYEKKIAEHKEKLEKHDTMISEMNQELIQEEN